GAGDLETIREWISGSGIRWGVDAEHRAAAGQPATLQNTWRFGLDRLLVGWAVGDDGELVHGVLPWADLEGSSGVLLGSLLELLDLLFRARERLAAPRSVAGWCVERAAPLPAAFAVDPATAGEVHEVEGAPYGLAE